jgi:hypothetical protein
MQEGRPESSPIRPAAADDEEHRHQQTHLRVSKVEVAHQPRKQWRDQQMEEVRGAMRERNERDDLAVAAQTLDFDVMRRRAHALQSSKAGPP